MLNKIIQLLKELLVKNKQTVSPINTSEGSVSKPVNTSVSSGNIYTLVPVVMRVRAVQDVNMRKDPSTTNNPISLVQKGTVIEILGMVTNGQVVQGNALWYKTKDAYYVWSGNVVEEKLVEPSTNQNKILHAPLPYLTCTQAFGERPEVYKNYGSPKGHNGLDFRTWVNNNPSNWKQIVFAVLDGKVSEAGYDAKFKGNYIRLYHQNGYESVYLHLDSLKVKSGQEVKVGDLIGISGNTGSVSEAPHLHFGYRPIKYDKSNGYLGYIDPTNLFIDKITYV